MTDVVECRSDSHYAERPVALYWQGERIAILEILARWRTPQGRRFRVRAQGGRVFDLFYDDALDVWRIEDRLYQSEA